MHAVGNMTPASLATLSIARETLLAGCRRVVGNAVAYTNIAALNPQFGQHMLHEIYVPRVCEIAPIVLARVESGVLIHGGGDFLVSAGMRLMQEQIPPHLRDAPERLNQAAATWHPTAEVNEECLLVARYGVYTWGHWLAELLPKVVLAETRYPGRFRFVLPARLVEATEADPPMLRAQESLRAYGIGMERVIGLQPEMSYRFSQLYAMSPIWSDHLMHPGAAAAMRSRLLAPATAPASARVMLTRIGPGRSLQNSGEIEMLLQRERFAAHTVGALSFAAQVALFRSASFVFAVLGSDLTGLIYAPAHVKVISIAPAVFGDRFFYALILDRAGRYADVRGPVFALDPAVEHRSSFSIAPAEVAAALEALAA